MGDKKEDEKMISENKQVQPTTTISDAEVMKVAQKGMNKYRRTLDKLSKN
ncbi:hypothetical protein [Paenibacillus polymyxa]|nr:hypothetical protein [Paenibacillus polymyxa]MDN4090969.1 hypothetical protein [Paenibacillus polymyxa]